MSQPAGSPTAEIREIVRGFILDNYLFSEDPSELPDAASLLEEGILDSTGILELVMFLEEEFGVVVSDEEMTPEHLDSVDNSVAFVTKKLASS